MRKTIRVWWFILLDMLKVSRKNESLHYHELMGKIEEHKKKISDC